MPLHKHTHPEKNWEEYAFSQRTTDRKQNRISNFTK